MNPAARAHLRLLVAATLALAACARPPELVPVSHGNDPGPLQTVLVSSVRAPEPGPAFYADQPAREPSFARFTLAPPDRDGDLPVADTRRLPDERAFLAAVNAALPPTGPREAALFVHGFRNTFAEALADHAELQSGLDRPGAAIHFAWPTNRSSLAYLRDFDRALLARDGLEQTIALLDRSEADGITLVATSLGAFLLMDTLRTMARAGRDPVLAKLDAVILIGADIEREVFRAQAEPVVAAGVPIYLVTSGRDRALRLAALLRGEPTRLGSEPAAALADLPVTVVDASSLAAGNRYDHLPITRSPELIRFIRERERGLPEPKR